MVYTIDQRAKMAEWYLETKSFVKTQRRYAAYFGARKPPSREIINYQVKKFTEKGTVHNVNKTRSGRERSVRSEDNIAAVRDSVIHSPKKSIRRRSQELHVPWTSVYRMLRLDLNLYPYQVHIMHKLTLFDKGRRVEMSEWFNGRMEVDPEWIKNLWFSDEAHFHLDGVVSSHNYRSETTSQCKSHCLVCH
jgi:hypothetical protein